MCLNQKSVLTGKVPEVFYLLQKAPYWHLQIWAVFLCISRFICGFINIGNEIRCQCYVKAYPNFWELFFPHLCTFMQKETTMPWAESRTELLVHLISKNLLLIKRILFTMQRFIDPRCVKEVQRSCTSVWSCKERSGIYTNSTACPNFAVPQLWDHIYSYMSFFILCCCGLTLGKCQAPISIVCLAFFATVGQKNHSKNKMGSNLKV